jgi:hypothetical protein
MDMGAREIAFKVASRSVAYGGSKSQPDSELVAHVIVLEPWIILVKIRKLPAACESIDQGNFIGPGESIVVRTTNQK